MQTAADMGKEIVIRFRADEDDRRRLEQLAKHEGMSPSTLLRVLLLRASRELGFEASAAMQTEPTPTATTKKASKAKAKP